ncbi:MAG TPA: alpha/beta fold hydrolase [Albitalea sp.]|nr:alpha/beta fold hydrolase [Albitalea sp.]
MNISRRHFGAQLTAGATGLMLGACGGSDADTPVSKRAVILVHGSWFGAWCYAPLIPLLAAKGITAVAPDLPGHGVGAKFPASFNTRPLDMAAFGTEVSPLAGITLADYANTITAVIDQLAAAGFGPITLLGHSMGGIPITVAAEANATKLAKLIYLSAFMPVTALPGGAYFGTPQGMEGQITPLLLADFSAVGAVRMDTNSTDAAYAQGIKNAFCADVSDDVAAATRHLMTPDDPASAFGTPTGATAAKWGKIPRAYIGCTQDKAVTPNLQQLFIQEADALTPANKTDFRPFDSSHSPFLSRPQALADLIAALAA